MTAQHIDIVFGPPGHAAGRAEVEVEDQNGLSLSHVGQWIKRPDDRWVLRLNVPPDYKYDARDALPRLRNAKKDELLESLLNVGTERDMADEWLSRLHRHLNDHTVVDHNCIDEAMNL